MPKFKDRLDREWILELVHPDIKKLRKLGLDLNKAVFDPAMLAPLDDPERCVEILWGLLQEQASPKDINLDAFENGFDGPTRARAVDCFQEAFADFGYRPAVAEALKKRLTAEVKNIENQAIDKMNSGSNASATNLPESLGSIPTG